jgi:hypothetical protein
MESAWAFMTTGIETANPGVAGPPHARAE